MLKFIVISERELLVDSHLVLKKTLLGIRTALHLVLFDTLVLVWIFTQNDYSSYKEFSCQSGTALLGQKTLSPLRPPNIFFRVRSEDEGHIVSAFLDELILVRNRIRVND